MGAKPTYQDLQEKVHELEKRNCQVKRKEQVMWQMLQRYEAVIDTTPGLGIQGLNRDGVICIWNKASEALYGFKFTEAIGQRLQDLLLPSGAAQEFENLLAKVWDTGTRAMDQHWLVRNHDDQKIWVKSALLPVLVDHEVIEVICINIDYSAAKSAEDLLLRFNDELEKRVHERTNELASLNSQLKAEIKDRVKAEKALKASEKRYRIQLEESALGVVVSDIGSQRFTYANPVACRMLAYTRKELQRMGPVDIHPAKQLNMINQQIAAVIEGESQLVPYAPCLRKDGKLIWMDIHASVVRIDGKKSLVAFLQNVTSRKEMEEALKDSEQRFRTVADFNYDWEYWLSPSLELIYVSPSCERITGYKANEFFQNKYLMKIIIHPDDRDRYEHHLKQDMHSRRACELKFRIITRTAEVRWIAHNCLPVFNAKKVFMGRRASNRDITDQQKAEEELRQAHSELEHRVQERTSELQALTEELKKKQVELLQYQADVEQVNKELLETNRAVSVLAKNIEKKKEEAEKKIALTVSSKILPLVTELKNNGLHSQPAELDMLSAYLHELTASLEKNAGIISNLSSTELRIATMIKNGLSTKDIANQLNISILTAKTHRRNIRKKLNLQNSSTNLATYLQTSLS